MSLQQCHILEELLRTGAFVLPALLADFLGCVFGQTLLFESSVLVHFVLRLRQGKTKYP